MQAVTKFVTFIRRQPRWRFIVALAIVAVGAALLLKGTGNSTSKTPTFTARRGPLDISVLEGGSLQALESQEIKCEVRVGYQGTKILKIVEEGYLVTEDDVKTNKVLVELDSSELEKQIVQQEISYQSSLASLTDAQQAYEIQLSQNESDVKSAEQKVRFARMDFDKFLGDSVTDKIVEQVGLDKLFAAASTNNVEQTVHAEKAKAKDAAEKPGVRPMPAIPIPAVPVEKPAAALDPGLVLVVNTSAEEVVTAPIKKTAVAPPVEPASVAEEAGLPQPSVAFDFSKYANIELLGDGEAKQKLRKFEDDLQVAKKELGQSTATLEGTRRLFDKGFVTRTDLQRDEIAYENSRLKVQTADTARDLFLKYEFLKSAEESLSKFAETVREFDKARRQAISKLAQARARLKSAEGQFQVQSRQRKDLHDQLEKCTLRAKKTGLVVYGSGRDDMMYYGDQERIREGATVRERQAIITIPDMTHMAVIVKIHESYIKKVKKGQKVRITVDAFPDKVLTGEVTKVGVLPDSMNRWMNPDLKVYLTTIAIEDTHDWVKPGMSAKVEIMVNRLDDVVYVPVQAISPDDGKHFCYLAGGERREVQIGEFNDEFIEVKTGLKAGERVLLRAPESGEGSDADKESESKEKPAEKPAAPSSPGPAPTQASKA
jgi:multidrug resistance efflux pump